MSIIHHAGIVLFLLWLLSSFNRCHPIAFILSLIYLFLVIIFLFGFKLVARKDLIDTILFLDFFSWFFRFSLLFHCQRFMRDMLWNWGGNYSMKKENKPIKKGYFLFFFSLYNFFSHFFFICLINGYFSLPSIGFTTSFNLINRLVLFLGMQLF
jgi:hypothetical protein